MSKVDYEAEYNNRARVKDHPDIFARWQRDAASYRATAPGAQLGITYGPSARQYYDFFPSAARDPMAPVVAFIHGGYWRAFDPSSFSHMAHGLNIQGVDVAVVGYDLCPQVTIMAIVDQVRLACATLFRTHGKRVTAIGHSAGGHLTACLVATDFRVAYPDAPSDLVNIGYSISGVFDLDPLVSTAMNSDLRLDHDEAYRVSPAYWQPATGHVLDAVAGGLESSEFLRQSKLIADGWGGRGIWTKYDEIEGANHFTAIDPLTDPSSKMVARVTELAQRTAKMPL